MRICLVGAANLTNNPRLLREADFLAQHHDVRVVCVGSSREAAEADARLMARRSWRLQRVESARADWLPSEVGRTAWFRSAFARTRRRLAESAFRFVRSQGLAERSVCASLGELCSLAAAQPADWFVAHTQPALPAAAAAAAKWNARLGFDCEDLLSEMGDEFCEANRRIEKKYLARCDYITATSNAMAEYLSKAHGVPPPVVLYNVLPLSLADGLLPPAQRPAHTKLRLHWAGQTIGMDRGLQDAFEACAGLGDQIEIHLRGKVSDLDKAALLAHAGRFQIADRVHVHPRIDSDELIHSMAEHDVGLALERHQNRNYNLTVTNKVFSYMLAGLAIAATDTVGQREVLSQAPGAGILYPAGDAASLRKLLQSWLNHPQQLARARQAAWDAARSRFCWDVEQGKFAQLFAGD